MCGIPLGSLGMDVLDVAFKGATVLIAGFNALFAVKIFRTKFSKDNIDKENDRKIQLLKTLVLDHGLVKFYEIFESLEAELSNLKSEGLTIPGKQEIESALTGLFIQLRRKFYDSLIAIDMNLYGSVRDKADNFQKELTETIFDQGVNLSHTPKFEELISDRITTTKTSILKILFEYRG